MPPVHESEPDKNGFRYRGDVLTGKVSVQEAFSRAALRAHPGPKPESFATRGPKDNRLR